MSMVEQTMLGKPESQKAFPARAQKAYTAFKSESLKSKNNDSNVSGFLSQSQSIVLTILHIVILIDQY